MRKTNQKLLFISVLFFVLISFQFIFSNRSLAYTAHSADDAINWVKSKAYQGLDYDKQWGCQCVDLIMFYYQYLGVSPVGGNGGDYTHNSLPSGWQRLKGVQPKKGDILVYTDNEAGHVAIYESDYSHWHQNFGSNPWVECVTAYRFDKLNANYWGVIRPDFKDNDSEPPVVTDFKIDPTSMTGNSYKVMFKASDNVGITKLQVASWSIDKCDSSGNYLDDIVYKTPSYNANTGYYECIVKASEHNNETGMYTSDVNAYDAAGNYTYMPLSAAIPMSTSINAGLENEFYARVTLNADSSYCIGIDDSNNNRSNVSLKRKDLQNQSQIWRFKKRNDGSYYITNYLTETYLDVYGAENENNTNIWLCPYSGSDAQAFYIMNYGGKYRFVPKHVHDLKAVNLDQGNISVNTNINIHKAYKDKYCLKQQVFDLERIATSINLDFSSITLEEGKTKKLTATITPSNVANKAVTWTSSNTAVATVNSNGTVTAKKAGIATITAKTIDGSDWYQVCKVTVTAPSEIKVTSVTLNKTTANLTSKGQIVQLIATVNPSNAYSKKVNWSSSNTKVATVDSTGKVTAIANGSATITATSDAVPSKKATCVVTVSISKPVEEKLPFNDVPTNSWFYEAVKYNYKNNIIKGYQDGTFKPGNNITRGQLVTILWRMENEQKVNTNIPFKDVSSGAYYLDAIKWASKNKVVNGYDDGTFRPDTQITRQQLAVILCNYAKYKGKSVTANISINNYKDNGNVAGYATESIKWAIKNGVMSGKDQGTAIDPTGTASRCECAAMIYNYCMKIK